MTLHDNATTAHAAPTWAQLLRRNNDFLTQDFGGGPRPWKLASVINFQKTGTFAFLALLMWFYSSRGVEAATSTAAWIYLALHGTYGLVWYLKDKTFPDPGWQKKVTILGGEPTIHATFFPILAHALALGFETIEIFTNGARLDKRDFIDRVLALGSDRFTWRISIQGWDRETHDRTTKKPGAFDRIVTGIETLASLGQTITCNMCVVEQNYRSLETQILVH